MYTQKAICKDLVKTSTSSEVQLFLSAKIIPVLLNKHIKTERIFINANYMHSPDGVVH